MTSGMGQAVLIIAVFAIFYFLKVALSIIGSIVQLKRKVSGLSKSLNIIALMILLLFWIPFAYIIFNSNAEIIEDSATWSPGHTLNLMLFITYLLVASLLAVSFKNDYNAISKSARFWWIISFILMITNVVMVAIQFVASETENKMSLIGAIWFIETLFFVVFFITMCLLPKIGKVVLS